MTAEIVIMNRGAIAFAADSAITLDQAGGPKIFNTANKLFALSKFQPVGVMVYGNAMFMTVPWETIIKTYRTHLHDESFKTLPEYATHFLSFLEKQQTLIPPAEQNRFFQLMVKGYFNTIKSQITDQVNKIIKEKGKIQEKEIRDLIPPVIAEHSKRWREFPTLPSFSKDFSKHLRLRHKKFIEEAIVDTFEKLPISQKSIVQLREIAGSLGCKGIFTESQSGLVIAGFGENDTFPSLKSFTLDILVEGKLKYQEGKSAEITFAPCAIIMPFAQQEMVQAFMEGVDPSFDKMLLGYLETLFSSLPDEIVKIFNGPSPKDKLQLAEKLKKLGEHLLKGFKEEMGKFKHREHVSPILKAVDFLPKDELANMAEALVNLTSFKRKITLDAETVGGPIDVAVISKGDGFIWKKESIISNRS